MTPREPQTAVLNLHAPSAPPVARLLGTASASACAPACTKCAASSKWKAPISGSHSGAPASGRSGKRARDIFAATPVVNPRLNVFAFQQLTCRYAVYLQLSVDVLPSGLSESKLGCQREHGNSDDEWHRHKIPIGYADPGERAGVSGETLAHLDGGACPRVD